MNYVSSKHRKLAALISGYDSLAIAFSGGVDSTLLLKVTHDVLGDRCIAITANLPAVPTGDFNFCEEFCTANNIKWSDVSIDCDAIPHFRQNPIDRCYHCKKSIFEGIINTAKAYDIAQVAEGSNTDDTSDYRPGMKAIAELKVISPLKEAGLSKSDIRELSKALLLPTHNKPATPCLATRIPYGEVITDEKLQMIDKAEIFLSKLGITNSRVRQSNMTARIEVIPSDFDTIIKNREELINYFKSIGYKYISLDLEGFRSGSLNEVLTTSERNHYK